LVLKVFDLGATVWLLPGFRDTRNVVKIEGSRSLDLRLGKNPAVQGIVKVFPADLVGGEHHCDGHGRQTIDGLPGQQM
jgi:hypothetical protein